METKKENNIANQNNSFFGFIKKLFIKNKKLKSPKTNCVTDLNSYSVVVDEKNGEIYVEID